MPTYSETPTPSDIQRRTRHFSEVAHNEQATAQYAGTAVRWYVRFFSAQPTLYREMLFAFTQRGFHLPTRGSTSVYATLDPSQYPELMALRRSQRLTLSGRVKEVDSFLGITIDLDEVEVVPRTLWDRVIGFFNRGPS